MNLFQQIEFLDNFKHSKDSNIKTALLVKALILLFTILICTFLISYKPNQNKYLNSINYSKGVKWSDKSLVAQMSFPIYKEEKVYNKELKIASENSRIVFINNVNSKNTFVSKIEKFRLTEIPLEKINSNSEFKYIKPTVDSLILFDNQKNPLLSVAKSKSLEFIKNYQNKYISNYNYNITNEKIIVQLDFINRKVVNKNQVVDSVTFFSDFDKFLTKSSSKEIYYLTKLIILNTFTFDLEYSAKYTNEEKELAKISVPKTIGIIKKGDVIVKKGEVLNYKHILTLDSYYYSISINEKDQIHFSTYFSNFGHITLILSFIILYLFNMRKRIFFDNNQFFAIFLMFILTSIQAWLSVEIDTTYPIEYLIFLPSFAMFIAIVFDSRTAFYATVTMSLLVASIRGNDYITALIMMFVGSVAAYTVRDIESRTQIFKSVFFILISFITTIFIFNLENSLTSEETIQKIILSVINAFISPVLTFGLVFLMEKTTNFSTNLVYKEFDNLSNKILMQLSDAAPGTFHHVRGLAALAENCALAIDANVVLVRAASYYHDIGKMINAEYFVENQIGFESKHKSKTPLQSAHIIIDHVKQGAAIAKKYNLPEKIIDNIYMHHGTTLVKHFYAKALESGQEVNESDFRYPGPKPNSKEAAIIMICDSAEAISRLSLDEKELENMLDEIIKERIDDGQFDECDITLKEINIIKINILKTIKGVGHKRTLYSPIPKK